MKCVFCKKDLAAGSLFCNYCGAKQALTYPSCGVSLSMDSTFCNRCGGKIMAKAIPPKKLDPTPLNAFEIKRNTLISLKDKTLAEIVIPDTVTKIGDRAFYESNPSSPWSSPTR